MEDINRLEVEQQQDSIQRLTINTLDARREGYNTPDPIPEPVSCSFCGRSLQYYGLCNPIIPKHVIVWRNRPERCTCKAAQDYWKRWDAREEARRAQEEQERQKQEEMQRFERLMQRSGMKGRFQSRRFDNFVCETDGQRQAYSQAKRYADNFARMRPVRGQRGKEAPPEIERNGLFIAGSYGTGKTHLAAAIANQLIQNGTAVICMTMIDLLDQVRATYKASRTVAGDMDEAYILQQYQDVPLLVIDDIGSEQPTEWGASKIFAIINARYEAYMPTIITTNYSGDELVRRMTPEGGDDRNAKKTVDRLKEVCVGIDMTWESWRLR